MPVWGILLIIISALLFFAIIHAVSKNKHPFRRAIISMLLGAAVLTAVDLLSGVTGVYIPVSLLSVLVSLIGGVPGVTLLLALNLFF